MPFPRKRKPRATPPALVLPLACSDVQVLRFPEWCALAGVSKRTGRRILASGTGPAITHLSAKRIGVSIGAHRAWLASRERAS